MCVPSNAKNKEGAEKFINFMCETEIAVRNAETVWYAIPHTAAYEALDEEQSGDTLVYPPKEVLEKCEVFMNLNKDTLVLQSELWINLKTQY